MRCPRGFAGCSTASPRPTACGPRRHAGGLGWKPTGWPCSAAASSPGPERSGRSRCWPPTPGGAARHWHWRRMAAARWTSTMSSAERAERLRAYARRFTPARMQRIAVVAPTDTLRDALVAVAGSGSVELDEPADSGAPGQAARALQRMGAHPESAHGGAAVMLSSAEPDVADLERAGRADLLAGEAQLQQYAAAAVRRRDVAAVPGWCPADQLP